ncbi:MAG TPA: dihydrodipicolinate synthetase [Phycisphaerales bacterium]|nr:dihydrodipicolinate synthetase [Phycisphaerales bacterium]HCD33028.1 dihydrodipicolinate synthetase [Phycisphaerales bacterium]
MFKDGLIAAPFTAMDSNHHVQLGRIAQQAQSLVDAGVRGAFICGTTGEGSSLSCDERMAIAKCWCQCKPAGLSVIVHVGHTSLREAQTLAEHAQQIGADAIAGIAPYFFKPATVTSLGNWCRELASAAPLLPFYYYHMPAMTGVKLCMEQFIVEQANRIPTFAGIKFTHEDLYDFGRCVDAAEGRYKMLFGRDEILLSALPLQPSGAVGSTYNFAAPLYLNMIHAYEQGDIQHAQKLQRKVREMIKLLHRYDGLVGGKAIMKIMGMDCGPVRLPLEPLSDERFKALEADVHAIGLAESIKQLEKR